MKIQLIKSMILISSILMGTCIFGSEKNEDVIPEQKIDVEKKLSYIRLDYGAPFLFTLNLGKRVQVNHHGLDISAGTNCFTYFYGICGIYGIQSNVDYIFFPRPNLQSQYYFGAGLKSLFLISEIGYLFSHQPEVFLGKEYVNKNGKHRFLEIKFGYYGVVEKFIYRNNFHIHRKNSYIRPMIYLCHGIEF